MKSILDLQLTQALPKEHKLKQISEKLGLINSILTIKEIKEYYINRKDTSIIEINRLLKIPGTYTEYSANLSQILTLHPGEAEPSTIQLQEISDYFKLLLNGILIPRDVNSFQILILQLYRSTQGRFPSKSDLLESINRLEKLTNKDEIINVITDSDLDTNKLFNIELPPIHNIYLKMKEFYASIQNLIIKKEKNLFLMSKNELDFMIKKFPEELAKLKKDLEFSNLSFSEDEKGLYVHTSIWKKPVVNLKLDIQYENEHFSIKHPSKISFNSSVNILKDSIPLWIQKGLSIAYVMSDDTNDICEEQDATIIYDFLKSHCPEIKLFYSHEFFIKYDIVLYSQAKIEEAIKRIEQSNTSFIYINFIDNKRLGYETIRQKDLLFECNKINYYEFIVKSNKIEQVLSHTKKWEIHDSQNNDVNYMDRPMSEVRIETLFLSTKKAHNYFLTPYNKKLEIMHNFDLHSSTMNAWNHLVIDTNQNSSLMNNLLNQPNAFFNILGYDNFYDDLFFYTNKNIQRPHVKKMDLNNIKYEILPEHLSIIIKECVQNHFKVYIQESFIKDYLPHVLNDPNFLKLKEYLKKHIVVNDSFTSKNDQYFVWKMQDILKPIFLEKIQKELSLLKNDSLPETILELAIICFEFDVPFNFYRKDIDVHLLTFNFSKHLNNFLSSLPSNTSMDKSSDVLLDAIIGHLSSSNLIILEEGVNNYIDVSILKNEFEWSLLWLQLNHILYYGRYDKKKTVIFNDFTKTYNQFGNDKQMINILRTARKNGIATVFQSLSNEEFKKNVEHDNNFKCLLCNIQKTFIAKKSYDNVVFEKIYNNSTLSLIRQIEELNWNYEKDILFEDIYHEILGNHTQYIGIPNASNTSLSTKDLADVIDFYIQRDIPDIKIASILLNKEFMNDREFIQFSLKSNNAYKIRRLIRNQIQSIIDGNLSSEDKSKKILDLIT